MIWTNRMNPIAPAPSSPGKPAHCLKDIHDRMPSILHRDTYDAWLDQRNQDGKGLQEILAERTVTEFKFRPVSRQVQLGQDKRSLQHRRHSDFHEINDVISSWLISQLTGQSGKKLTDSFRIFLLVSTLRKHSFFNRFLYLMTLVPEVFNHSAGAGFFTRAILLRYCCSILSLSHSIKPGLKQSSPACDATEQQAEKKKIWAYRSCSVTFLHPPTGVSKTIH